MLFYDILRYIFGFIEDDDTYRMICLTSSVFYSTVVSSSYIIKKFYDIKRCDYHLQTPIRVHSVLIDGLCERYDIFQVIERINHNNFLSKINRVKLRSPLYEEPEFLFRELDRLSERTRSIGCIEYVSDENVKIFIPSYCYNLIIKRCNKYENNRFDISDESCVLGIKTITLINIDEKMTNFLLPLFPNIHTIHMDYSSSLYRKTNGFLCGKVEEHVSPKFLLPYCLENLSFGRMVMVFPEEIKTKKLVLDCYNYDNRIYNSLRCLVCFNKYIHVVVLKNFDVNQLNLFLMNGLRVLLLDKSLCILCKKGLVS